MVIIKKKLTAAAVISFTILGLCACGKETARVSTVSVDKEGKVESVLYDAFDKDYYSLDELKNMAEEEISDYNSEYENPRITLSDARCLRRKALLSLQCSLRAPRTIPIITRWICSTAPWKMPEAQGMSLT